MGHHRHPETVNTERVEAFAQRRRNWIEEEDELLRNLADTIWREEMTKKDLYEALHRSLPQRSQEAIKKRLQLLKWKPGAAANPTPQERNEGARLEVLVAREGGPTRKWSRAEEDLLLSQATASWKPGKGEGRISWPPERCIPPEIGEHDQEAAIDLGLGPSRRT